MENIKEVIVKQSEWIGRNVELPDQEDVPNDLANAVVEILSIAHDDSSVIEVLTCDIEEKEGKKYIIKNIWLH